MSKSSPLGIALFSLLGLGMLGGCADEPAMTGPASDTDAVLALASDGLGAAAHTETFWPFTGRSPSMSDPSDPINLVFVGQADPRDIRAALMALDGDRSPTFPAVFPFDCTWKDAMGAIQTAYEPSDGWTGNAIQLECGAFDPIRFHIRMFELAGQTIANVHMDLLIPDTPQHVVIAWEAAEQFVTFDMARTGLLGAAPGQTSQINPTPSYRDIPDFIYNGIPVSLRAFIGGPPGNQTAPVPLPTDGKATVFTLAGTAARQPGAMQQSLTLHFDQVIPNPVCSTGPTDYVLVQGPIDLKGRYNQTDAGPFFGRFDATGSLTVTPIDISTGQPSGPSYGAKIREHHNGQITPGLTSANSFLSQTELPRGVDRGRLVVELRVSPGKTPKFVRREDC